MQIAISTKIAKCGIALAIPVVASAYWLVAPETTKTTETIATQTEKVARGETQQDKPKIVRVRPNPADKPGGKRVRPQPDYAGPHTGHRPRPGRRIAKPKHEIPAA